MCICAGIALPQSMAQSEGGPTMFDAVEKLGLKLSSRVRPLDVIVVDQCRKMPTEN